MDDITPLALANIYACFFAEDFALDVMRHLSGSYPISEDTLRSSVSQALTAELNATPFTLSSDNAIGRFVYECAVFAIEENTPDKTSRAAWDHIKALPSQHHAEIQSVIFQASQQYLQIVNKTLLGTIGRDAALTHAKIKSLTDERLRSSDSSGVIREFSWGILSDGQWLNSALMKAYDLAAVFRPGDRVIQSYGDTSINFAYQYATVPDAEARYDTEGRAELNALMAHSDSDVENDLDASEIGDSIFQPGYLRQTIDVVKRGVSDVKELIWATERLSKLANHLRSFINTARMMDEDDVVSPLMIGALNRTQDAVTLALVAIEALRETKFAESLILLVESDTENGDPLVTVTVNADTMRRFTQSGGSDNDLILFGHYLDPRKGVTLPAVGWGVDTVLQQRDAVVPQMMSEEADRVEQTRNNDAAFIDKTAVTVVRDVVSSYLKASDRPLLPYLEQQIDRFGRDVANPNVDEAMATEGLSPDAKIAQILVAAIGDPFLEKVRANFTGYSKDQATTALAPQLTVMRTALQDALHFMSMSEQPVTVD